MLALVRAERLEDGRVVPKVEKMALLQVVPTVSTLGDAKVVAKESWLAA